MHWAGGRERPLSGTREKEDFQKTFETKQTKNRNLEIGDSDAFISRENSIG